MLHPVQFVDLHVKDYKETWEYQQNIHNKILAAKTAGHDTGSLSTLIFVEHPHVFTLGKSGKENNLLINPDFLSTIHASFYKTDRGGDITYHGPGQLVGYPVFDLDALGIGVKKYIFLLEESVIKTLAKIHIKSTRLENATGVWLISGNQLINRKICAIGVKVSRSITMHGFALNVNSDLNYFSYINPCGFTDKGVTSVQKETGSTADMETIKDLLAEQIAISFGLKWYKDNVNNRV